MKEVNVVADKFFRFAVRVVNLYKFLCAERKEFILSKQLLRSGTAIGALISIFNCMAKTKTVYVVRIVGRRSPSGWENALLVGNGIVL